MMKSFLAATVLVAGASTLAFADMNLRTGRSVDDAMTQPMMHHRHHRVRANGRCNGVSYGTGQGSCGTATGGTPGGNPSRN